MSGDRDCLEFAHPESWARALGRDPYKRPNYGGREGLFKLHFVLVSLLRLSFRFR